MNVLGAVKDHPRLRPPPRQSSRACTKWTLGLDLRRAPAKQVVQAQGDKADYLGILSNVTDAGQQHNY